MARNLESVVPVILCGGSGTRLWPRSRKSRPKQFESILGDHSLYAETLLRFANVGAAPALIVTSAEHAAMAKQLADAVSQPIRALIAEPSGRNSGPAALVAALLLDADGVQAPMLLSPSDHFMGALDQFAQALASALAPARAGQIVCFGITPTRPETGFGWISPATGDAGAVRKIARFVEKPAQKRAEALLAEGALWNAGIFMATPQTVIAGFAAHAPEMLAAVRQAMAGQPLQDGVLALPTGDWDRVPANSIDYALMEKAQNLSVVALDVPWSDIGDWGAVWQIMAKDSRGVIAGERALALDCDNTLVLSEPGAPLVAAVGLRDMVAIAAPDAVLIAPISRAQEVRNVVDALRERKLAVAESAAFEQRPWGKFESVARGSEYQVKRIEVRPGGRLSLQSHKHRSEHWVVVQGTARITIGAKVQDLGPGESVYVPVGTIHRLENPGETPVQIIEVQVGDYLGEDDIIRYDDVYARGLPSKAG